MRSRNRLGGAALCLLLLGSLSSSARAVPALRYQTDLHGDLVLIGNTMGFDCRAGLPDPQVGSFDRSMCTAAIPDQTYVDDSSADVFWSCDDSGAATAAANVSLTQARSGAMLQLPAGASVAYARLYWSSTVSEDMSNASSVVIDRPGTGSFKTTVAALPVDLQAADRSFQATADITSIVQANGPGLYRVAGAAGFPKSQMVDHRDDNNYAAWAIVVLYQRASDPVRNLAVYDGLTFISPNSNSSMTLRGFVVPTQNADAKLAVVGYEGDHDQLGDTLIWKGNINLSDGQPNSTANFFNSSRTNLGQPLSIAGDLPQLTGAQGSMSGIDLDVVDLTPFLAPSDTQAQLDMITGTSIDSDRYFVGAVATSIASHKPVIDAELTVPAGISPLPGDTVEYTLTVRNVGDDTASDVIAEQDLPDGLNYVPGTLTVENGLTPGVKTDASGDDQFDYDALARVLRIRLGTGASSSGGGTLAPNAEPIIIKYQLSVADSAFGTVGTQVNVSATPAAQMAVGTTVYPSGDGTLPNHPTVIAVRECGSNYDCTVTAPVCDVRLSPHRCTAACASDTDCQGAPGGQDVCGASMQCSQCATGKLSACTGDGLGSACLPSGACGCMTDADCAGRKCDTTTNSCPKPSADLNPVLSSDTDPADADSPVDIGASVNNKGPALAPSGTQLLVSVPAGGSIASIQATAGWRCTLESGTAQCTYFRPIAAGASSPEVKLVITLAAVDPQAASPSVTISARSSSTTSTDPNIGDNVASRTIDVGHVRVAGGGFGCSYLPDGRAASLWSVAAVLLAALVTRRRRWKNRVNA